MASPHHSSSGSGGGAGKAGSDSKDATAVLWKHVGAGRSPFAGKGPKGPLDDDDEDDYLPTHTNKKQQAQEVEEEELAKVFKDTRAPAAAMDPPTQPASQLQPPQEAATPAPPETTPNPTAVPASTRAASSPAAVEYDMALPAPPPSRPWGPSFGMKAVSGFSSLLLAARTSPAPSPPPPPAPVVAAAAAAAGRRDSSSPSPWHGALKGSPSFGDGRLEESLKRGPGEELEEAATELRKRVR